MSFLYRPSSRKVAKAKPDAQFVDLSNNQGPGSYLASIYCKNKPFLIHKGTQGLHFVDQDHAHRCEVTHGCGRAMGHYHFAEANGSPELEAEFFWTTIRPHFLREWPGREEPRRCTDFLILDLETIQGSPKNYQHRFEDTLRRISKQLTLLYCDLFDLMSYQFTPIAGKVWLAAYPGPVPRFLPNKVKLWGHQYTQNGRTNGIVGPCDLSVLVDPGSKKYWGVV